MTYRHILALYNDTKYHPKVNWLGHSYSVLFHFYCKQIFVENLCGVIVCLWNQIISSSFCCYKFNISMFSHILHCFTKTALFVNLKKSFSKLFFASVLSLLFISMYGFNHLSWLKLITLETFFKIKSWFKACFKNFCMNNIFTYILQVSNKLFDFSKFLSLW